MNEQLTHKGKSGHTNTMEDSGEKLVLTEVGKAFKEADSLAHGLEAFGKEISKKSQENKQAELEEKKRQEAEKKKAEAKIREELAKTPKDTIATPEEQEKELSKLIAPLSQKEQNAYKQILTGLPDTAQRASFLSSIRSLLKGQASVEQFADLGKEEVKKMKVTDVVGEASLEAFIQWKLSPKIEQVKKQIIEHVREEGVDLTAIDSLSQEVESAIANEKFKLKAKAKKGEWDKVRAQLTQIMSDVENREKRLNEEHSEPSEEDVDQKITERGELEKEIREAEVKTQVKVAADRFRKGEVEVALPAEAAADLDNKPAETDQPVDAKPETSVLAEPDAADNNVTPSDESDHDETVGELNRVTEPKGKLNIDPEVVYANAGLTQEEDPIRIERAEDILGKKLSEEQQKAVLDAHYFGVNEDDKSTFDKRPAVYNYSVAELRHKYKILEDAEFEKDEIRKLMEYGITGSGPGMLEGIGQDTRVGLEGTGDPHRLGQTRSYTFRDMDGVYKDESPNISLSGSDDWETRYKRSPGESPSKRIGYERMGSEERAAYYDDGNLEKLNKEIYAAQYGKTVEDDVGMYEEEYPEIFDFSSPTSYLNAELDDPQMFSIKGFNKRLFNEMHKLFKTSRDVPAHVKENAESTLRNLGSGLEKLKTFQDQRDQLEHELSALRDQYWLSNGSQEVKLKIREGEKRLKSLEDQFKAMARPLLNELGGATQTLAPYVIQREDEEHALDTEQIGGGGVGNTDDGGEGGGGDGRNGGGRGRFDGDTRGPRGRERGGDGGGGGSRGLGGRGEGGPEEESLFGGKAVKSIEDLGEFMEMVTEGFEHRIMAALYRGKNAKGEDEGIVTEDQIPELQGLNDAEKAEYLKDRRLYAYKVDKREYARDYNNEDVPSEFRGEGHKILMLTADEIRKYYDDSRGKPWDTDRSVRRGQEYSGFWEAVKVVRPDEFMNWIRNYWTIVHGDDPDNPGMNFFSEIVVNAPDQRGAVSAGQMHKNAGAFLRSRFLTDPATGELRVYDALKDQIINEVWVPSGERNKEIHYKKVMHSDEELPKQLNSQITADNLMAKTAAGGKNTMEMFFTLPEKFRTDFDPVTGDPIPENKREDDIGFGSGMLLAYEIYYNISDFEGLKNLLGKNSSMFNRDFITRAVLEVMGSDMPDDLNSPVIDENGKTIAKSYYALARNHLLIIDEQKNGTIIDEELYDADGRVNENLYGADGNMDENKVKNLRRWIQFMNPYYPVQKDDEMLKVIRKVVENQMQEIVGIENSPAASGLAEFHAYYRTYHDGIASRHDIGMGNRNSQSKYEFLGAPGGYQDKQEGRDRSGNLYNKGIVWGPTVGVLHAMPTRDGETVQDVLKNAVTLQVRAGEAYRKMLLDVKSGQQTLREGTVASLKQRISAEDPTDFENDPQTNDILRKIRNLDEKVRLLKQKGLDSDVKKESRKRYLLVQEALEARLRNEVVSPELSKAWETFQERKKNAYSESNKVLSRLKFDEVQYAQYGGMHYNNSTGIFHMEMNSQDLPMDKISGRDYDGRVFFKTTEFGPWLEESEKKMRYTIETWPMPLGASIRKLVNPRKSSEVPKYVDMPLIESVFGSYDYTGARNGGVMGMAQKMINRELRHRGKDPVKFTDGKGNIVSVRPDIDENGKPKRDKLGNIIMIPDWESDQALVHRDNLKKLVGYVKYDDDNNLVGFQEGMLDDPAKYFTRAYVKMRIANFILSHTDKATPYERWTVHQREEFFHALELSNYFDEHDIEDIREFSDNGYWKNFGRDTKRALKKEGIKGLFEGLKYFFSNSVKT